MNKAPVLRATMLFSAITAVAAAFATQGCSNGESIGTSTVMGNGSGATSGMGTGTGGSSSSRGTGGSVVVIITSTGGSSVSTSSGGASVSTGGGTGGAPVVIGGSTGGSNVITGTGSGGASVVGTGALTTMSGFVTSGPWHGYAFTSTSGTTTISPVCDAAGTTACFKTATTLCATGTVPADTTYMSTAELGFNVGQAMSISAVSPVKGSVAATGTALVVTITGYLPGMRAQIQNAASVRWCAPLTGPTTTIPWATFNTMCYAAMPPATGAFAAGMMFSDVGIIVPSLAGSAVMFDFCLSDAHPNG